MSVPGSEEEYPPPAPPVKKKKEILEKHYTQLRQADAHAKEAPPELNNSFDDLVQYLTQDMTLDLQKVKAVLIWLSRQNFVTVRSNQGGEKDTATPRGFLNLVALKKKELVHLFETLCRKAGVPCVILSGYCKAEAKYYSDRRTSPETNSHWVAVRADGQWGFVHLTMAFRHLRFKQSRAIRIEMSGQAVRERDNQTVTGYLDEDYFLPDPDHFIYMCRPQHDVWQLLEGQPWSWTRFIEAPDKRPRTPSPPPKPSPERPKSPPVLPIDKLSVPDSEKGYPPPCPPKGRKKDIFDEKEFQRICERSKKVCEERLYYSYKDLFAYLFESLDTDVKKAGALLSWLSVNCHHYYYKNGQVTTKMYKEATDPDTPVGAIKLRHIHRYYTDCLTKEQFFAVLCRQAKLPCVLIRGHKKRADLYKLGSKKLGKKMVWTAVHLDGDWRLINVHDAIRHLHYEEYLETDFSGNVREDVTISWTDKMNEFFFLTDPDEFIHFCFPDDERWQLLDQPLTRQQFLDEPWLHPPYFSSPLRITPGYGVRVQAQDGEGSVLFEGQVTEGHLFRYNLYFIEDKETSFPDDLQLASFITSTIVSKTPRTRSVLFRLPVTGTYVLEPINESGETLCKLLINCFGDTQKNQPFPGSSGIGYGFQEAALEAGLEDASREEGMIVVREGDKVRFRFGTSSSEKRHAPVAAEGERVALKSRFEARLIQGGGRGPGTSNRHVKVEEEEGKLVVEARVPRGSKDFQIAVQIHARDEKGLTNAANYLLTSNTGMAAKAARRTFAEQIASEMVSATEEDDVDRLEVALRESRYARLRKVQAVEQVNAQQRLMTLHKNACVQAMESGDVEALESAMMATHRSQVSYYIHRASWFEAAEKSLRLLKRQSSQQKIKQSTGNETLSQKHVDEVRRFHRPSQHVHTVLTATLTLLGESTHAHKEWKHIQSLLRVRGASSMLQRIKNYKRSHSKREDVKKAETLLSTCTLQAVTSTGPGIAAFYHWVRSVLDQTSEPGDKQADQTGDQTDAQAAGQADAQTGDQAAGQADAQTGQADAQTGQANAQTAGQPNAQTAGQANAQKTGQTDAQKAGQVNAQTSGQANAQTAG